MKKVLIINSSARITNSQSRAMTALFQENWQRLYPTDHFIFRDLGIDPIPHIDDAWIKASFTKVSDRNAENQAPLALSNKLVRELKEVDIIVFGLPMYNWGVPSGVKAYMDQIMRINETWKFESGEPDGNYVGLLSGKKAYILSARGDNGYGCGERNEHMNFQSKYVETIFRIIGIGEIETISLDSEEYGGELFQKGKERITAMIKAIK
ncbi:FMN-dependent NADH-azoreductase [Sphingobacterium lactis]|uniref:FMN-dependent NADH-azoreductase n=1 Tax=Sphingobacterium lactis TaxID=797291 RepID=UPI003EC7DF9A